MFVPFGCTEVTINCMNDIPAPNSTEDPDRGAQLPDWDLLERYIANDMTAEDQLRIDKYITDNPNIEDTLFAFRRAVSEGGVESRSIPERSWKAVENAIGARQQDNYRDDTVRPSIPVGNDAYPLRTREWSLRRWILTVLPMCLGVLGAVSLFNLSAGHSHTHNIRTLTTAQGQRASLQLSDGTSITLGVASKLTIPDDFGESSRTVLLRGEAAFNVMDKSDKPFIVKTSASEVRVLGTSFTVRDYEGDSEVVTTVYDGKVSVGTHVVVAGQQAVSSGRKITVSEVSVGRNADWVDGTIAFTDTPLYKVIADLNRWYQTEFILDDSELALERVTLNFQDRSADEVAAVLGDILGTSYRRLGNRIIITR